jgi:hypothetical protein
MQGRGGSGTAREEECGAAQSLGQGGGWPIEPEGGDPWEARIAAERLDPQGGAVTAQRNGGDPREEVRVTA